MSKHQRERESVWIAYLGRESVTEKDVESVDCRRENEIFGGTSTASVRRGCRLGCGIDRLVSLTWPMSFTNRYQTPSDRENGSYGREVVMEHFHD